MSLLLALTVVTHDVRRRESLRVVRERLRREPDVAWLAGARWRAGFWYSGTILAILGCHELGHYFACRYYDVDASLPFFLPVPAAADRHARRLHPDPRADPEQAHAVRHRDRGANCRLRRGGAGAVHRHGAVAGRASSRQDVDGLSLGEPLLFKFVSWLMWGTQPEGYTINLHPIAFAAWFGMLATALNLFPIGQLDGGHISYAVLGRTSSQLTLVMVGVCGRPDVVLGQLAGVDRADDRDALHVRAPSPAHVRRGRPARFAPQVARAVRGR